jgi:hypothetical protein
LFIFALNGLISFYCKIATTFAENERFVSVTEKPQHPLQKIRLGAFYLSGNKLKTQKYQIRLSILLMHPGETQLSNSRGII